MHCGKAMKKVLSVVLSAAMLFSSSSMLQLSADEAPGGGIPSIGSTPGDEFGATGLPTKAVSGNEGFVLSAPRSGNVVTDPKVIQPGDVMQFNFTKENKISDYIGINMNSDYSEDLGYGLDNSGEGTKANGGPKDSYALVDEESDLKTVCSEFVRHENEIIFLVDVPSGVYNVTVYAHSMGNSWNEELFVNNDSIGTFSRGSTVNTIKQSTFSSNSVTTTGKPGLTIKGVGDTKGKQGFLNAVVIECVSLASAEDYTIKYDINGGNGISPEDLAASTTETANLNDGTGLTKTGYRFVGWAASADAKVGKLTYNYSADNAKDGVVTLYAVWVKEYELFYNSNGGDSNVPTDAKKYIVGEEITLDTVTKPVKKGFTFLGWATSDTAEDGIAKLTVAENNIVDNKIQVYAVWQAEGVINLKFDFGNRSTVEGFTCITNQMYSADVGYGFTKKVAFMNDKGTNIGSALAPTDEKIFEVIKDYTYTTDADGLEFQVDVPAGTYDVSVYAGLGGEGHTPSIKVNGKDLGTAATAKPNNENELLKSTTVTLTEAGPIIVSSTGSAGRNMLNGLIIKTSEAGAFPIPQNVRVSSTATSVELTWDAVASADHYTIFRHAPSGDDEYSDTYNNTFFQIGMTEDTSFTDPVLTDKIYEYYVIAVGSRDGSTIEVSDPSETVTNTIAGSPESGAAVPAENYSDRALVAVKAETGVLVSWRLYESDSSQITFTLKRNGETVYTGPKTNYMDLAGKAGDSYTLTASEGVSTGGESTVAWAREYQEFTLQAPADQTMPDGSITSFTSNDMSVGDLDGDGELELIVKWYPDNAKDNSQDGYTGTTILDAYDIDIATGKATLMWRIDLGLNIRSGAHYTQYQVWDFDGDGKAELICKTADGSTTYDRNLNETGHVGAVSMASLDISKAGTPAEYDFRKHTAKRTGRIVLGDEYLTAFDGETGEIIDSANYVPFRGPYDEKTQTWDTSHWGYKGSSLAEANDGYANRADRFLSGTGYVDGGCAAAIFTRGYYDRTAITAWKLTDGKLVMQWTFDAPDRSEYAGQGNHGLSINDVDNDGYDEVVFAGLVVDHNGVPMANTHWGHGDAMHVSDWNGDGKLEVYKVNEEHWGAGVYDPATGEILWFEETGGDTGRGVAGDIDPRYLGAEMWHSLDTHTHDVDGNIIYEAKPSQNFTIFWDGDLLTEMFDSNNSKDLVPQVQKWNYDELVQEVLVQADGTQLNNGTKANAGLVADIYGDWREEFIVRDSADQNKIRIYSTTIETEYSFPCLLEDRAYREGVAWQNVAYNQPANVTYLLSNGLHSAVITDADRTTDTATIHWEAASDGKYGHSIGGYRIYRVAAGIDAASSEYVLVGEVDGSTLEFTDTGLTSNTEYSYKVEAVVDGKIFYMSLPFATKTSVAAAGVQNPDPITIVQDTEDYESRFPATVLVTDVDGKEQNVDITWDYSTFDIHEVGEKIVYGTIYGHEEKVPVKVTVLANKIVAIEELLDVYTLTGVEPTLPSEVTLRMYNNTVQNVAVTWNKTYQVNTPGIYEITGDCTSSYKEAATVTLVVHVVDDYVVSVEKPAQVELEFDSDATGKLPATVMATFAKDGRTEAVAVEWGSVDTSQIGIVTVYGTVENYAGFAEIDVKIDYPIVKRFDFGTTESNSLIEDGWIGVQVERGGSKTAEELDIHYTAARGYGFLDKAAKMIGRRQEYTQEGFYPKNVYTDLIIPSDATTSNTFVVDVENGDYIVEMISGSTDSSTIKVNVEGKDFSVHNDASTYEVGRFEVITVKDGQLTMQFTSGNLSRVCAVIVRKMVEGSSASMTEAEKVEKIVEALPEVGSKLNPNDKTNIDTAATKIAEMTEEEKNELPEAILEKLDALYGQAHNLKLVVDVDAPADVEKDKVLSSDNITAKGALTASGAEYGIVSLEIIQQKPTKEPTNAQIEFKAELKVNTELKELKAPIIISITLPDGVETEDMQIKHYSNEGELRQTMKKGNTVGFETYVLNDRTVTFRVNSFSIFSFVSGKSTTPDPEPDQPEKPIVKPERPSVDYDDDSSSSTVSSGWVKNSAGWWYRYSNGGYPVNKWEKIQNKWYYFDQKGYRQTGWIKTNDIWYFCKEDGTMADAEWVAVDGKWYYLNAGGNMAVDWIFYKEQWYYLNADGSMQIGWILNKDKWYFLNEDGSMKTGWLQDNNKWYYLKQNGEMAVSETTPDGYQVGADGVWIQ